MRFKQWDPTKCKTSVGGHTPRAFAEGEMLNASFTKDKRSLHIGVDGEGRHLKSADRSGTFTIKLASYSPSVAYFQALDDADVPFPIAVVDKSSNGDSFFASSCTLVKPPDMVKGDTETPLEYKFQFVKGRMIRSGAEAESLLSKALGAVS